MKCKINSLDFHQIVNQVIDSCPWHKSALHGIEHWIRVERNALFIAEQNQADTIVVRLFAIFHDCKRINDASAPTHGSRAADFILSLDHDLLNISTRQMDILTYACRFHTHFDYSDDPTIAACWDADRLDITRVIPEYNLKFFSTEAARKLIMNEKTSSLNRYSFNSILEPFLKKTNP